MIHPVDRHVGKKIKELRIIRGLTQSDVAQSIDLSFQQLQKYETGSNRVSASRMYELSKLLNVAPAYFFEGLEGGDVKNKPPVDVEVMRLASVLSGIENKQLKQQLKAFITEIARSPAVKA